MQMEVGDRIASLQHTFEAVADDYKTILTSLK
jgi:hypothetical protein